MAKIERGSIWLVDLGYVAKERPCLVLSVPIDDQDRALHTVVSHTTQPRGSRYEISIQHKRLDASSVFDTQQLFSVTSGKFRRFMGTISMNDLAIIEQRVKFLLGFDS